jgi:sodium/bile acid cotransporter 7
MAVKLPRLDPYVTGIFLAVVAAAILPVRGGFVAPYALATKIAVALLFFLYGARLPRETVFAGLIRWRLHLLVLSITFVFYPLVGLAALALPEAILGSALTAGFVDLCCMPSTIQSSVALVAAARGDIAAAVCSASASNLIGVVASPVLVGLLVHAQGTGGVSIHAIEGIVLQLLLPFALGQLVHPWVGGWTQRHRRLLAPYDRFTILMIVYGAFSAAVVGGVWREVTWAQLIVLLVLCALLLALVMTLSVRAARAAGFAVEDEIVVAFCGTQKGLAAGVPMAALLFPPAAVGLMVLPLMVYHQLQLTACAVMAGRYARRAEGV